MLRIIFVPLENLTISTTADPSLAVDRLRILDEEVFWKIWIMQENQHQIYQYKTYIAA